MRKVHESSSIMHDLEKRLSKCLGSSVHQNADSSTHPKHFFRQIHGHLERFSPPAEGRRRLTRIRFLRDTFIQD